MEYHKLQQHSGVLSPSKLRMKLTTIAASHHLMKKNTTTTSDDQCLVDNNSLLLLLLTEQDEKGVGGTNQQQVSSTNPSDRSQETVCKKKQKHQVRRSDSASAAVHPTKSNPAIDDQSNNHECDSNASSSSFEFPNNGERVRPRQLSRSFSKPASSKWNDAEKWIMTRPSPNPLQRQTSLKQNQLTTTKMLEPKTVDLNRFSFSHANLDLDTTGTQSDAVTMVRAVSMRDMGTEMTPIASQDPSRASTPMGATTPLCSSPTISIPCTPGRDPPPKPEATDCSEEEELKLKTRREIIALGVQLGKKNIIAALAAEQEEHLEHCAATQINKNYKVGESVSEFEYRAAAWEQVEKTKHEARFKREEVMIQVWESRQKTKLEAEMRRIEAKVEEMKFQCQTKMLQKIATTRHRSETKRAKAEAKKNQQTQTSAAMAGYIRRKGHIPYTYMCCGWS